MIVQTTQDDFENRIKEAKKEGALEVVTAMNKGFRKSYDELTSGFFSRLGREANIEFARRMIKYTDDIIHNLQK